MTDDHVFGRVAQRRGRVPAENPFSTERVRPGRIPYHFPLGITTSSLAADLAATNWWGQVIGPHGAGKSALLSCLSAELERRGRWVRRLTLHQGQHRLPIDGRDAMTWDAYTQVIIDGYEQLWLPSRVWLQRVCRRQQAGLLVSAHRCVGLPTLWEAAVTTEVACELANDLLVDHPGVIDSQEVAAVLQKHRGNLRDTFFELYDLFEERTRFVAPLPR